MHHDIKVYVSENDPIKEANYSLTPTERAAVWEKLMDLFSNTPGAVLDRPVCPLVTQIEIQEYLSEINLNKKMSASDLTKFVIHGMQEYQLHIEDPAYFGVFNPKSTEMGVVAESLTAFFNPQLASYTSSPFAIEVEQWVGARWGEKFGYQKGCFQSIFTSGGTEANFTALQCALAEKFDNFSKKGAKGIPEVAVYLSEESHHSFFKACRLSGIGEESIRVVQVDSQLRMDTKHLETLIEKDISQGVCPLLIVATLGTTNAGIFDPLNIICELSKKYNIWLHADAAWGGAAVLLQEYATHFRGINLTDSITFDTHKWLNVPMTAGMFFVRRSHALEKVFRVKETQYMPSESQRKSAKHQPYAQSLSWSRGFTGLKVFMQLAVAGWQGIENVLRHQIQMGELLREKLISNEWKVLNDTPFPVCCFVDNSEEILINTEVVEEFAKKVTDTGRAWITTCQLGSEKRPVLRAGISNFLTQGTDLDRLIEVLNQVRKEMHRS